MRVLRCAVLCPLRCDAATSIACSTLKPPTPQKTSLLRTAHRSSTGGVDVGGGGWAGGWVGVEVARVAEQ
jgi:hypothetical protein